MVANAGRTVQVYWGEDSPPDRLDGVREKSIALNGEAINITDDNSDGWRELLDVPAVDEVNISISGVTKNDALKRAWFSRARTGFARFVYEDGSEISGTFYLVSYTDTGPYEDALTFEAELQNSGPVNYDPAST